MPWCSAGAARAPPPLQMHVVVDQPVAIGGVGRISCRPVGREPVAFQWSHPLELDATGSEASGVAPGRYRVVAVDALQSRADVSVDVQPSLPGAVVVEEYRSTPASTSRARDGAVEAVLAAPLADGVRLLWTSGVETDGAVLRDVPCGVYAAVAVARGGRGPPPPTVHLGAPARVEVGATAAGRGPPP